MNVLVYLVPMALALGLTGLAAFLWSLKSGQYDDVEGAALRVLGDDDLPSGKLPPPRGSRVAYVLNKRPRPNSSRFPTA